MTWELDSDVVEAGAKALFFEDCGDASLWDRMDEGERRIFRDHARVAVSACLSAMQAQPARFEAKNLNRRGWHCGLCEPGEYENCHHCTKACDELAGFLNRNYSIQPDMVQFKSRIDTGRLRRLLAEGEQLSPETVQSLIGVVADHQHRSFREWFNSEKTDPGSSVELDAELKVIAWEGGQEFQLMEIPDGKVFIGVVVETSRRWSLNDKHTLRVEKAVEGL